MNIEQVLRDQFPIIHASRSAPHQPLREPGVRYVVSSQGLWRELIDPALSNLNFRSLPSSVQ